MLAFDTATDVATSALVDDGEVLGERASRAVTLLEDVDALLRQGGAHPRARSGTLCNLRPMAAPCAGTPAAGDGRPAGSERSHAHRVD